LQNVSFGIEAAFDIGGLPEPVLLAREQELADRVFPILP
jgi:hypothetical protein